TKTASTRRVGNAATVELSPVAGQNVLDIRAGIISDQEKLKYLQEYIRAQCRKKIPAGGAAVACGENG
ncbi:bacteriophage lysis protein, partial [Salmonella enterica subsp. enterica serovar Newport str. 36805]